MTCLPTWTDCHTHVAAAARLRVGLVAPSVISDAASLLSDLYIAGRGHGVSSEAWQEVTSLPGACLDVQSSRMRSTIPQTPEQAIALLEAVARAACSQRRVLQVPVAGPATFGRYDVGIAVTLTIESGWALVLDIDDLSPAVAVTAPHDPGGAREVAALAKAVAVGDVPNPFRW